MDTTCNSIFTFVYLTPSSDASGIILYGIIALSAFSLELYYLQSKKITSQYRLIGIILLSYVIAQGVWLLDQNSEICEAGFRYGHGLWHILNAVAAFYLYKYLESRKNI